MSKANDDQENNTTDHQIAADVEQDVIETTLQAAATQAVAIDFAMPVYRRHENGRRAGFDRRVDKFVLADHHPQIDDVKTVARQRVLDDLIPDRVTIGADNPKNHTRTACNLLHHPKHLTGATAPPKRRT